MRKKMKRHFWTTLILIILVVNITEAIDFGHHIKIKATDALGQTDSVLFVLVQGASIGLDTALGEQDISMMPYNDIDLRIIQRNTVTCTEDGTTSPINYWLCGIMKILSFENNYDFKQEMRGIDDPNIFKHFYDFVVKVHAVNYPVTIIIEDPVFDINVPIAFYDTTNNQIDSLNNDLSYFYRLHPDDIIYPLCVINNESENHLFGFLPDLLTDVFEERYNYSPEPLAEMVYPNPGTDIITIVNNDTTSEVMQDIQFAIFDEWGNYVKLQIFSTRASSYDLDISGLVPGTYFIKQNINLLVKQFIKI
jgi:hypothetical protein